MTLLQFYSSFRIFFTCFPQIKEVEDVLVSFHGIYSQHPPKRLSASRRAPRAATTRGAQQLTARPGALI